MLFCGGQQQVMTKKQTNRVVSAIRSTEMMLRLGRMFCTTQVQTHLTPLHHQHFFNPPPPALQRPPPFPHLDWQSLLHSLLQLAPHSPLPHVISNANGVKLGVAIRGVEGSQADLCKCVGRGGGGDMHACKWRPGLGSSAKCENSEYARRRQKLLMLCKQVLSAATSISVCQSC